MCARGDFRDDTLLTPDDVLLYGVCGGVSIRNTASNNGTDVKKKGRHFFPFLSVIIRCTTYTVYCYVASGIDGFPSAHSCCCCYRRRRRRCYSRLPCCAVIVSCITRGNLRCTETAVTLSKDVRNVVVNRGLPPFQTIRSYARRAFLFLLSGRCTRAPDRHSVK